MEEPHRHGQIKMAQFNRVPIGSKITYIHEDENGQKTYALMELMELKEHTFVAKIVFRSDSNQHTRLPCVRESHYTDACLKPYSGGDHGDIWNSCNWIRVEWVNRETESHTRRRLARLRRTTVPNRTEKYAISWKKAGF